mmetsp:Transcript_28103/g.78809  ORF Transcript_28103/g.78809 Transcript_28103/m.78809 type:complete len:348 (-) Transcript_28103:51-1094(-)
MEEVPLEVAGHAYVHAWRDTLRDGLAMVLALGEESVQNIILVGCHHQLANRKSHLLGVEARQDVTKVSGWDGVVNELIFEFGVVGNSEVTPKVVRGLCQHAAPIDGVDGPQLDLVAEFGRVERCLDDVLTVIEGALHGNAVDVGVFHCRHLALLDGRNASQRKQDDAVDALLASQSVNGSGSGVAGCGTQHRQLASVGAGFQEVLEKVAQHLQRNVLEGERRPVKEFQNSMTADLDHGRHILVAECRARSFHDVRQFLSWHLVLAHELGDDVDRQVSIRQAAPLLQLVLADSREGIRHEQTAIVRQARHDNRAEVQVLLAAASGGVRDGRRHLDALVVRVFVLGWVG